VGEDIRLHVLERSSDSESVVSHTLLREDGNSEVWNE